MGALIVAEGNGEGLPCGSIPEKICASDPVVYQLVRVEGDGRLVPATDDELMEVEHLLEDDKRKFLLTEAKEHSAQCPSDEGFPSNMSDLEGPEGPLESENLEVDPPTSDAMNEEERLQLKCEAVRHSPDYMVVDGQSSDNPKTSKIGVDKVQSESTSIRTATHPICLSGQDLVQSGCAEPCSDPANETVSGRSSVSELYSNKPDFSLLKGEVCLDSLTIRELQEVFRATFGRQTNVKDKLWLKRRIAMGLTNSCHVPTSSFVIKENMIVPNKVKEAPCRVQRNVCRTGFLTTDQVTSSASDRYEHSSKRHPNQTKDQKALSGKRPGKPLLEYDTNENHQTEQSAAKRIRKPTKRYIEELSEVDLMDCNDRLISSVKSPGHGEPSPKSQIKVDRDIIAQGNLVTRKDSLGGSGIRIPYVSRVRRSRPRKNFFDLMNFVSMVGDKRELKTSNSEEERDKEHVDHAGDNSDANADISQAMETGHKRKHHRAWTLCEVLKLVEGVARYGAGRWSEIRRVSFASHSYRTSVDLKDKWRNLLRASFAQEPSDKGARNLRKPTSMPIPTPILLRVRELAEMHSPAGIEFRSGKFSGHDRKFVQEKEPGFL
ncbi:uncharacterized protein M6B38_361840 [Iris pallida]|uniref:Uncharacterized protein n=1 Tax=Iris pallida TaxID=29817 RepID=A0AAX6GJE7_IRIPA|nr:uncharacterized protein M6B38_361840 [Iris pallida]